MNRDISPPPSKRRRVSTSTRTSTITTNIPPPSPPPPASATQDLTIYSWNINGITPYIQPSITTFFGPPSPNKPPEDATTLRASLRDFLRHHNFPDLLFLQEVKINPSDSRTLRAIEKALKRPSTENPTDAPDYEAHFCLPNDPHNARGFGRKIYGVCSIVRKDFLEQHVTRIRPVDWDREGRFLIIETKATAHVPKLALINVYAVNGTENPYRDSLTGEVVGTRHDRKLQVHALLQAECRRLEAEGFGVVVAGDLNIAREPRDGFPNLRTVPRQHCVNRADFEEKFFSRPREKRDTSDADTGHGHHESDDYVGLGMIDTFRYLHPTQRAYTYYPRTKTFGQSCDRVDLIMVSRSLESSLKDAGMHETPGDRGPSDHVPLYARLGFGRLTSAASDP